MAAAKNNTRTRYLLFYCHTKLSFSVLNIWENWKSLLSPHLTRPHPKLTWSWL